MSTAGRESVDQGPVPTVSNEKPLDPCRPFMQQVRIRELLVDDQSLRACDAQRIRCLAAAGMDLVVKLLGAPLQSRSHT